MTGSNATPEAFQAARRNVDSDLHSARHMPGVVYSSKDIYEVERERIFMRSWLCVGREEEIAEPGDYYASRVMDEPFLVVRDGSGKLNAFSNSCRHRGVEVARGRGSVTQFSCPYHAWTYDLNGKLMGAPQMRETRTDLGHCALPSLPVDTWQGWVFINFDADAPPLTDAIAEFDDEFGFLKFDGCRLGDLFSTELGCNWKYVVENLMDIYHVGTIHAKSFGKHYRDRTEDYSFKLRKNGGYSFYFKAAPQTPEGKSLVGPIPSMVDRDSDFACLGFIAPNINFSARWDSLRFWVTWPLAPDRSQLLSYTLFSEQALSQPDFEEKLEQYVSFLAVAIDEDREMMESLQNGSAAGRFEPGPMSWLEQPIHHVVQNYLRNLDERG